MIILFAIFSSENKTNLIQSNEASLEVLILQAFVVLITTTTTTTKKTVSFLFHSKTYLKNVS